MQVPPYSLSTKVTRLKARFERPDEKSFNGPIPASFFVYFRSFPTQILQAKTAGVSVIRTRIVRVEGEQADHLTTTTAQQPRIT